MRAFAAGSVEEGEWEWRNEPGKAVDGGGGAAKGPDGGGWAADPAAGAEASLRRASAAAFGDEAAEAAVLTIRPDAKRDYWRNTFYSPALVADDGPALVARAAAGKDATFGATMRLTAASQFDQGGLYAHAGDGAWMKAGIEFVDGAAMLSCVVTSNGFSDWSTQPWAGGDASAVTVHLRVHRVRSDSAECGPAVVVEAGEVVDGGAVAWRMIRIAQLGSTDRAWRVGAYACCPQAQRGCSAVFAGLHLGPYTGAVHGSDLGGDGGGSGAQ